MRIPMTAALALALCAVAPAQDTEEPLFHSNVDAALTEAYDRGAPILLMFTRDL